MTTHEIVWHWVVDRSEFNLEPGGAVDIVMAVVEALAIPKATFFGSDWGAGMCLSLALKHPSTVERIVVLHASYSERKAGELRRILPKASLSQLYGCKCWFASARGHC